MRKISILIFTVVIIAVSIFSFYSSREEVKKGLTIYAYDSFVSEWGPGPVVIPAFEEEYGIEVSIVSVGDSGQVLQKAILEKNDVKADLIIGIDNNLLARVLEEDILDPYESENLGKIPNDLLFDSTFSLTPFDYGYFSIIYDSEKITVPPASLSDLLKEEYSKSIILMDPRTSSPGLGFLLWTVNEFGEDYKDYWKKLAPSILTITDGWDSGYGLFTQGEAPMVLSYTTSPAYHVEYEKTERYKAAVFNTGHYMQIEGIGILKNAPNRKAAELFIDFVLEEKFQSAIPLTNWMYPVRTDLPLPDSFKFAPKPPVSLIIPSAEIEKNMQGWISGWADAVTE